MWQPASPTRERHVPWCRRRQLVLAVRWPSAHFASPNRGRGFALHVPVTRSAAVNILAQELCTDAHELGSLCIGSGESGTSRGAWGRALWQMGNLRKHSEAGSSSGWSGRWPRAPRAEGVSMRGSAAWRRGLGVCSRPGLCSSGLSVGRPACPRNPGVFQQPQASLCPLGKWPLRIR